MPAVFDRGEIFFNSVGSNKLIGLDAFYPKLMKTRLEAQIQDAGQKTTMDLNPFGERLKTEVWIGKLSAFLVRGGR